MKEINLIGLLAIILSHVFVFSFNHDDTKFMPFRICVNDLRHVCVRIQFISLLNRPPVLIETLQICDNDHVIPCLNNLFSPGYN